MRVNTVTNIPKNFYTIVEFFFFSSFFYQLDIYLFYISFRYSLYPPTQQSAYIITVKYNIEARIWKRIPYLTYGQISLNQWKP